jgi:hypothetical protein
VRGWKAVWQSHHSSTQAFKSSTKANKTCLNNELLIEYRGNGNDFVELF